jgi:hypothetical protein
MKYIVSEVLVFLIALAVFSIVGTSVVMLFVLVHECGRWSVRKFKEVTRIAALSLRVESDLRADRDKTQEPTGV